MKVQKFRGNTSLEALAKVKEGLGEDAVILSTRRVKEGKKWVYEITAAVDLDPPVPEPRPRGSEGFSVVLRELEEVKRMIQALNFKPRGSFFQHLLEQGLPAQILKLWGENGNLSRDSFLKGLSRLVNQKIGPSELPRQQLFVGQAGVGKTTSLVKLAARLSYGGKEVALISLDSVRVGAKEQISRFAQFLELPVRFVRAGELNKALEEFFEYDYVLIDTPALGASFSVSKLRDLLQGLPKAQIQLVIRAGEAPIEAQALWERMRGLPICSLILTHSESLFYGAPLFWIFAPQVPPVSFLSTGDRVPEDFERATPKRLLGLLLRNVDLEGGDG